MPYELTIRFEGLFLFVQRQKTNPGLYVLLPDHPGHTVEVWRCDTGQVVTQDKIPQVVDWRPSLTGGGPKVITGALSMKAATQGGTVKPQCFNDPPVGLLRRIHLPFPMEDAELYPENVLARADYDPNLHINPTDLGKVAGVVKLKFEMTNTIKLDAITVDNNAELRFYHAPTHRTKVPHGAGERLEHAHAYLDLITGGKHKPTLVAAAPYTPGPTNDDCPNITRGKVSIAYVDPVMCTVGTGCSEDDTDCT